MDEIVKPGPHRLRTSTHSSRPSIPRSFIPLPLPVVIQGELAKVRGATQASRLSDGSTVTYLSVVG